MYASKLVKYTVLGLLQAYNDIDHVHLLVGAETKYFTPRVRRL